MKLITLVNALVGMGVMLAYVWNHKFQNSESQARNGNENVRNTEKSVGYSGDSSAFSVMFLRQTFHSLIKYPTPGQQDRSRGHLLRLSSTAYEMEYFDRLISLSGFWERGFG